MWDYKILLKTSLLALVLLVSACKKEKTYVYQVNDVVVANSGTEKPNVKTQTEFISIAYTDIFGTTISQEALNELETAYISFGDKGVIEDLIIKNLLNQSGNTIPSQETMDNDPSAFVQNTYRKLFNREPNEYELWYHLDLISKNSNSTPELFYFALMTSDEYRQY